MCLSCRQERTAAPHCLCHTSTLMSQTKNNSEFPDLDRSTVHEIHVLCSRLFDENISIEEQSRLKELFNESDSARRLYLRCIALNTTLAAIAGIRQERIADASCDLLNPSAPLDQTRLEKMPASVSLPRHSRVLSLPMARYHIRWATAAVLLLAASAGLFWLTSSSKNDYSVANREQPSGQRATLSKPLPAPRVTYVSATAQWRHRDGAISQDAVTADGTALDLVKGEVELTYSTGSRMLLVGPARFVVRPAGGVLHHGGLVASISESGHGFTIETPNGKVVDLGTEFGVAVDDLGVSEVSVFEGKVEAFPNSSGTVEEVVELFQGEGLQWDQHEVKATKADLRRFVGPTLHRAMSLDQISGKTLLSDDFHLPQIDPSKWKVLGDVRAVDGGVRLRRDATSSMPAYLISSQQFDPARGAITVTCDFHFDSTKPSELREFSILTRCADERGTAPAPWSGDLATAIRCSFRTNSDSHGGQLRAGVKLDSIREVTSVALCDINCKESEEAYRVVMRDDGVNVTFTVSPRKNPSEARLVECRSLFHGASNFIALEGPRNGSLTIDRVTVSQDSPAMLHPSYTGISELFVDANRQRELECQVMAELEPANATLVLQDNFSQATLDNTIWTTLGSVQVRNGAAQIGVRSPDGSIDTWKQRHYLLTRQPIDTVAGEVTILGRILFADNHLSGYGASFAVMTRTDERWGHDQGWANYLLRRGVRANFWPGAWDRAHGLEIHNISGANAINLIAKQESQVDPCVRSYVFRVVDNGTSLKFTIIDPGRADEPMSIDSPTALVRSAGRIGFESTWGSPITLKAVKVFQSKRVDGTTGISNEEK